MRFFSSRALDTTMPRALRSPARLARLHAEEIKKQKRLQELKLNAERKAGLRV